MFNLYSFLNFNHEKNLKTYGKEQKKNRCLV